MRVFLFNQKMLSVIDRKEEMTDETCLITEQEAEKIAETLAYNGVVWRIDRYTVGASGGRPTTDHIWNDELKEWQIDPKLVVDRIEKEREQVWRTVKTKRLASSYTGVKVGENWYHTTVEARNRYDELARASMLDMWEDVEDWKTLNGKTVVMTLALFKEIVKAISLKSKHDFENGERLSNLIYNSDEPYTIDVTTGWSEKYNG